MGLQLVNKEEITALWTKIKKNFAMVGQNDVTSGSLMYFDSDKLGSDSKTVSTLGLPASNVRDNSVLGITSGLPAWKTISSSLAFSETTANQPKLKVTVLGTDSSLYSVPLAGASASGFVSQTEQQFAGKKIFNGGIQLPNNVGVYLVDYSGSAIKTIYLGANNYFHVGWNIAKAGYNTVISGQSIELRYGGNSNTDPSSGLFLSNEGNVGIGTTSPSAKLHVIGGITARNNIQSTQGGVAAMGLADLTTSGGGGGSGTVKDIKLGSGDSDPIYTPNTDGRITLPAYPTDFYTQSEADNKFATITSLNSVNALIPSAATSSNQLADKAFVNSSISTATATHQGTYNLITDLNLTTSASRSQIASALGSSVSGADNNDYAFVEIPTSDSTPTLIARVERYKYNGSAWAYEYTLNNSGFTAVQWGAINSGVTSTIVGNIIPKTIGTTAGDIIYFSAASSPERLGIGNAGQYLKAGSDAPAWASFVTPTWTSTEGTGSNAPKVKVTTDGGTSADYTLPIARKETTGGIDTYYSGVITGGNQTFGGEKTFDSIVNVKGYNNIALRLGSSEAKAALYMYSSKIGDTLGTLAHVLGFSAGSGDNLFFVGYGVPSVGASTCIYGDTVQMAYSSSRTNGFILDNSGNVGIGSFNPDTPTLPDAKLHVKGTTHITGAATLDSTLSVGSTLTVTGASTFNGNIMLANDTSIGWKNSGGTNRANLLSYNTGNNFVIGYSQNTVGPTLIYGKSLELRTNGNTSRLTISDAGAAQFSGTLGVTDATTLSSTLDVSGLTTIANKVKVSGVSNTALELGTSTRKSGIHLWSSSSIQGQDASLCNILAFSAGTSGTVNDDWLLIGFDTPRLMSETRLYGYKVALYSGWDGSYASRNVVLDENGNMTVTRNIQSTDGGVAAMGIADLALSGGGGGSGTVQSLQVNTATPIIPDTDGKLSLDAALTSGTTNAVSLAIGGSTLNITQSTLRTSLGLGAAAYLGTTTSVTSGSGSLITSGGVYSNTVSALGTSGNNLTWTKGGTTNSITVPYATKASQDGNGAVIANTYLKLTGGTLTGTFNGTSINLSGSLTMDGALSLNKKWTKDNVNYVQDLVLIADTGTNVTEGTYCWRFYSYEALPTATPPSTGIGYMPMIFGGASRDINGLYFTGSASYSGATNNYYWGIHTNNPAYMLDVNGTFGANTIYENGTALSSKYLPLAGGTMTGIINRNFPSVTTASRYYDIIMAPVEGRTGRQASFGYHNDGDTDGAFIIVPYAKVYGENQGPWSKNDGLYISKTSLLYNGNTVWRSDNANLEVTRDSQQEPTGFEFAMGAESIGVSTVGVDYINNLS